MAIPSELPIAYAGFPSPAEDYLEQPLDISGYVVKNPPATFYMRVAGDSMLGAGIFPGDLVVVDRSLDAHVGDVVIVSVNGGFAVKRLAISPGGKVFESANPEYDSFPLTSETSVWGVVTFVVHSLVR